MPRPMRSLKLSHVDRAVVRKLYARRCSVAKLMRMYRCCQATINRAVRNHMNDDIDDDDKIIRNAVLSADVAAMLGLKERGDGRAFTTTTNAGDGRRPLAQTRGVIPGMPVPRSIPRMVIRSSPTISVESTGGDSNPHTVAGAESDVGSALQTWEKPAPDSLASVEGFLASIQLGEDHVQMLLDEGIKTHQDLLCIKGIIGTESLILVKESLKARGFTSFELIRFISAVKGIPT